MLDDLKHFRKYLKKSINDYLTIIEERERVHNINRYEDIVCIKLLGRIDGYVYMETYIDNIIRKNEGA